MLNWLMHIIKNKILVYFFLLIAFSALAQKKTELDSIRLSKHYVNNNPSSLPIDSSLYKFHQYNSALLGSNFFAYTGNIGLAARNIEFVLPNFGFNTLPNNFFCWDFSQLPLSYYNTTHPFTKIDVVFGSKKELISNVLHTQNINEFTNVGFMLNGLRSDGFSTRQQTSSLNARVFYSYKPTNIRYNAFVNLDWGRVANQENGGIRSDSASLFLVEADSRLVPTYFANSISNRVGGTFTAIQYFNLGNIITSTKDSVETKTIQTKSKFYHKFSHSDLTNLYSDIFTTPETSVYINYYEDSLTSREKIQTKQTQNTFGWNNFEKYNKDSSSIYINVGISHNYIEFHQKEINSFYNNISGFSELKKRVLQNFEAKINADLFVSGYNLGDYKFNFSINKNKLDSSKFTYGAAVFSTLQHPDYIVNNFSSNHFRWTSNFKQQLFNGITANVNYKKQAIQLNITSISNFIFYNFDATPTQFNGTISVVSAKLFSDFNIKKINFSNIFLIQKQVNGPNITRLPFLFTRHTIFYQKVLFKNTTPFQMGAELNYNSAYFANAYMPSSGQFYLQSKQKIGNYITVDLYMSFKIKSAKVFVKSEHLNNKLFYGNYYLTPFYPMHDRAFAAGISWCFVN